MDRTPDITWIAGQPMRFAAGVWLLRFASVVGAPPPPFTIAEQARQMAGEDAVYYRMRLSADSNVPEASKDSGRGRGVLHHDGILSQDGLDYLKRIKKRIVLFDGKAALLT
jgi:hypothetical protein